MDMIPANADSAKTNDCYLCDAGNRAERTLVMTAYKSVQFRFPRSKKKRIQKKWAKDPRNWRMEHEPTYITLKAGMIDKFIQDTLSKKLALMPRTPDMTVVATKDESGQISYRRL